MLRSRWWILVFRVAAAAWAAGCSGEVTVSFVGLEPGALLGGDQVTTIDSDISASAARAELYLDYERIAIAEAAPFSFEWSTVPFHDGGAQLLARVYDSGGDPHDGAIRIVIDNTPPVFHVIPGIPWTLLRGDDVTIPASDANGIVAVSVTGPDHVTEEARTEPFAIPWTWPCGDADFDVAATDGAGWTTHTTFTIHTLDSKDVDCDQHVSFFAGGDDCDDNDPNVHPGAPETDDANVDRNCDGLLGADADGDGHTSVAAGGDDCDDGDPSVNPDLDWRSRTILVGDEPVLWVPGTADAIAHPSSVAPDADVLLAINQAGSLEIVTVPSDGSSGERAILAEGINPGRPLIAPGGGRIFYGKGPALLAKRWTGSKWTGELVLDADSDVGEIVQQLFGDGSNVAVRAGHSILFAHDGGSGWRSWLVDSDPTIAGAPVELIEGIGDRRGVATLHYFAGADARAAEIMVDDAGGFIVTRTSIGAAGAHGDACWSRMGLYYVQDGCILNVYGKPYRIGASCFPAIEKLACGYDALYAEVITAEGPVVGRYRYALSSSMPFRPIGVSRFDRWISGWPDQYPAFLAPGVLTYHERPACLVP